MRGLKFQMRGTFRVFEHLIYVDDPNREPFRLPDDKRFEFLHDMANKFKDVDTSKSQYKRVMC